MPDFNSEMDFFKPKIRPGRIIGQEKQIRPRGAYFRKTPVPWLDLYEQNVQTGSEVRNSGFANLNRSRPIACHSVYFAVAMVRLIRST